MEHGQEDFSSRCGSTVTAEQTEGLLEFIEQNLELLKNNSSPLNRSKRLWSQCAKKLNSYPDGAKKTSSQWAQSWSSLKQEVGKKTAKVKAAEDQGLTPPNDAKLTMTETRIWSLIKMEDRISGVGRNSDLLLAECRGKATRQEDTDKDESSNQENIRNTRPDHPVKQKRVRKTVAASQRSSAVAKLRRRPQTLTSRRRNLSTRRPRVDYEDIFIEPGLEDNLSALLELEKKKLEDAVRLNEAVKGIRERFADMHELFGELREDIMAAIITR